RSLVTHPRSSSVVMVATVAVVVTTHDLAQGVLVGALLSTGFFAMKVARLVRVVSELDDTGRRRTYRVSGRISFATSDGCAESFDLKGHRDAVAVAVTHGHFWDASAAPALARAAGKFRKAGAAAGLGGRKEGRATTSELPAAPPKSAAL